MIVKPQPYILAPQNITANDLELVGREALLQSFIHQQSLPTPKSFVLTSKVFDDFLSSGELIDHITKILSEVNINEESSLNKAYREIDRLIKGTSLPSTISRPLIEAYRNLSDSGLTVINLSPSNLLDDKYIPNELKLKKIFNIYGEDNLITAIKDIWMYLFDPQSIKLRIENNYEGFLSTSVYIQKMIRAEVSGEIHTTFRKDTDTLKAFAIYGIDDGSLEEDIKSDIYVVDKNNLSIKEKTIVTQEHMLLRKGKTSNNQKIEISQQWQKEQKLDDERILKLSELTNRISDILKKDIIVKWGIEAGIINIFSIKDLDNTNLKKKPLEDFKTFVKEVSNLEDNREDDSKGLNEINHSKRRIEPSNSSNISMENSNIKDIDNVIDVLKEEKQEIYSKQLNSDIKLSSNDINESKRIIEKKYISNFYLNTSEMNSTSLKLLEEFDGAYIDLTTLLLKSQILPDLNNIDSSALKSLSESLNIQLNTASLKLGGNLITIRLSNIDKHSLHLLGKRLDDVKYINDERLINNDKALKFEIDIVKKLRLNHRFKNINILLPDVRSLSNALKLKKEIVGNNLRRSQSTKLLLEVNIPNMILNIDKILSSDWDGIVINLTDLTQNLFKKEDISSCDLIDVLKLLKDIRDKLVNKKIEFHLYVNKRALMMEDVLNEVIKLYPNSFIVDDRVDSKFLELLEKEESRVFNEILKPLRKRGPKFKNLF